jgi:hypothetical protein
MKEGGTSLDLDRSDGSVWLASDSSAMHCSADGKKREKFETTAATWRWVTVVPQAKGADPSSSRPAPSLK